MDLDLAQVRAFAAAAGELHFGHAARRLSISQQALSKRIARLEDELGVRLFTRTGRAVELTEAGRRFIRPARQALAAGDRAVAAARLAGRPLRIDVWGHLYAPMRTVSKVISGRPELRTEVGHCRDFPAAVTALLHEEIDTGFGRVHPLGEQREAGLASRLARLEPVDAVLSTAHPLAGMPELRPADLRDSTLWCPAALDRLDFLRQFAGQFGISAEHGGANLGLDHLIDGIRASSRRFTLLPADIPLPGGAGIRSVPLAAPVPLYAWSLVWPSQDQHPQLGSLLQAFTEFGGRLRWLEYDPARDWLPARDHAALRQLGAPAGSGVRRQLPARTA